MEKKNFYQNIIRILSVIGGGADDII